MTDSLYSKQPLTSFSWRDALDHWSNGDGSKIGLDMFSHMQSGGGKVFSASDFASPIGRAVQSLPIGSTVTFETNRDIRLANGASKAIVEHNYYGSNGFLSDGAYVWGNTSAGFRGTATVIDGGRVYLNGEIRPFTEQFGFEANTWNPVLEAARFAGKLLAGPGTPYNIEFVGSGLPVEGVYQLIKFGAFDSYNMVQVANGPDATSNSSGMSIAEAQKLYQVQKSTGWLDKTPSERAAAIELASSMKPSAKTVANDPGGLGLGPGSRDGGNSFPSGRPDRDQQGGGSSGSSGNNGSSGRADRDQQGGTPSKTTGGGTTGGRADRDQQGGGSTGGGSSNKNHYDQVSKGNVKSGLPVALDLDGDGIEVSFFTNAAFDLDGDGFRERTAWVAPDDALLVIDLNADGTRGAGDGKIDQTKEVVLAVWGAAGSTDLQALAEARDAAGNLIFDTNGDGQLTAADTSFAEFRVWQDKDQDGVVDEGELTTLAEAGITQIGLRYDDGSAFSETSDDRKVGEATLKGVASFVKNGKTIAGGVGDLALGFNEDGYRIVETADGFLVEFETGETLAHRNLQDGEVNLDLGSDAGNIVSASGNAADNQLDGRAKTADILLSGGLGADTLLGGSGDDLLVGGKGRDVMHGGAGDDVIHADAEDVFFENGTARITGGDGYDRLVLEADVAFTGIDIDALGFEAVDLSDGANVITGRKNDVNYFLDGRGGADSLTGAGGNDILVGGDGADTLVGNAGNDRLFAEAGNDRLEGGDGDDVLAGGRGADTLRGGAGDDTYFYQRGDGTDLIHDQAFGSYQEKFTFSEAIAFTYNEAVAYTYTATVLRGAGKRAHYVNELRTGYRIEQRTGYRAEERTGYRTVEGEIDGGIDTLQFGSGIRLEDILLSRSGADMVVRLRDDANADQMEAGDQVTIVDWSDQKNRVETFALADGTKLDVSQIMNGQFGFGAADVLIGTSAGDFFSAGNGADTIHAGAGRDIASGGAGDDQIFGGEGKDFLFGDAGQDALNGGAGDDYLIGGTDADRLAGDAGNDVLAGESGNDLLQGGDGNDLLLGGTGNDTLEGGSGDDTYFFFRGDGRDLIHDHHTVAETVQEATGNMLYQRSGKSGVWVAEMRTVTRMAQRDGGYDKLQFGYGIGIEDLFAETVGNDLQIGIRDLAGPSKGLAALSDVVTIKDWGNAMNRVERFDLGDGQSLDMSGVTYARSGLAGNDLLNGTASGDFLSGGHGNDSLSGLAGKDYLIGGEGDDRLDGGAGDDDLFGGNGTDALFGGEGLDYLLGGRGADTLEGGSGNDVLTGGAGDDVLKGGLGNDTYVFNRGDGHDRIDESAFEQVQESYSYTTGNMIAQRVGSGKGSSVVWVNEVRTGTRTLTRAVEGGEDVLQFGKGIDVGDLILRTANTDMVIELTPVEEGAAISDSVTIAQWTTPQFRVETLRFANGFVVDISDIEAAITSGSGADGVYVPGTQASWVGGGKGDDTLHGSWKNDIIMGGVGNDTMRGDVGDDTYIFSRGDGADFIADNGSSPVGADQMRPGGDKLLFGAGITIEDLILRRVGHEMKIYVGNAANMTKPLDQMTDHITVQEWMNPTWRVDVFQFFDGMDFNMSEVSGTFLGRDLGGVGSVAQRELQYIASHADLMQVYGTTAWLGGNHFANWGFYEGRKVTFDGLRYIASNPDLIAWLGVNAEGGAAHYIQYGRFEGRQTTFNAEQYLRNYADLRNAFGADTEAATKHYIGTGYKEGRIHSTATADAMSLSDWAEFSKSRVFDDLLAGSSASDWIDGFGGNDTLDAGTGNDFLFGRDGDDRLLGGDGADILSGGVGRDSLFGGNQDDIMTGGADADQMNGDAGNDVLMGGDGDDTLNGGAGNDLIVGDRGNDTYIASAGADIYRFGFGDGQDVYQGKVAGNDPGTDVFVFEADVSTKHLWFERVGNDLWVRLVGAQDRIEFRDWFYSTSAVNHISGFQAGGEFLSHTRVQSLIDAMKDLTPNDGETAYGVTAGDLPQTVANAIDAAWQNAA